MEREVNVFCKELCSTSKYAPWILTAQLLQLMTCFDIFLESSGNSEFPREKIFLRPVR